MLLLEQLHGIYFCGGPDGPHPRYPVQGMLCPTSPPNRPHCCQGRRDRDLRAGGKPPPLIGGESTQGEGFKRNSPSVREYTLTPGHTILCCSGSASPNAPSAPAPLPSCCWKEKGFLREWQQFFPSCSPRQGFFAKYQLRVAAAVTALSFSSSVLLFSSHAHHTPLIPFQPFVRYAAHIIFSPRVLMALQVN